MITELSRRAFISSTGALVVTLATASDVTVTGPKVRRVTLLHAIFSFLYVVAIIGLVVNILGNVF